MAIKKSECATSSVLKCIIYYTVPLNAIMSFSRLKIWHLILMHDEFRINPQSGYKIDERGLYSKIVYIILRFRIRYSLPLVKRKKWKKKIKEEISTITSPWILSSHISSKSLFSQHLFIFFTFFFFSLSSRFHSGHNGFPDPLDALVIPAFVTVAAVPRKETRNNENQKKNYNKERERKNLINVAHIKELKI